MAIGQNKAGNLVTIDTTVCSSFTWIDGFTYTHDTVALYTSASDSTVYVLNLTMSGAVTDTANVIELDGICSVNWNNKVWSTPGSFFDTLSTVSGCDSIVKLQITLAGESHDTIVAQACDEYVFDSVSYTASGNYTITETEGTCHTYTHLFLTIANTMTDTASVVVRDTIGGCNITWDGQTYSFADTNRTIYALGTTSVAGCDSLMAIRITGFTGTQRDTNYVENCGYYLWEGDTLRTSGIYTTVDTTATCIAQRAIWCRFTVTKSPMPVFSARQSADIKPMPSAMLAFQSPNAAGMLPGWKCSPACGMDISRLPRAE
jgi:hypothetical protein